MKVFDRLLRGMAVYTLLVATVFPFASTGYGQSTSDNAKAVEERFATAVRHYGKAEYKPAAQIFGQIARDEQFNRRTTAAYIMLAKSQLYSGDGAGAENTVTEFLRKFPSSSYLADALYTLGLAALKQRNPEEGVRALLDAMDASPPPLLEKSIFAVLDEAINSSLSLPALRSLSNQGGSAIRREYLHIKLAEKLTLANDYTAAAQVLQEIRSQYLRPAFGERLDALEKKLREPRDVKLGILLPLMRNAASSSRERETGTGLYEGVLLALDQHPASSTAKITLDVRDTQRDNAIVTAEVRKLAADPGVVAIIGPAFSTAAFAAAVVVNESKLPLITPTANATGLAATGPYVFQASPDLETRARAMAQHAVEILNLRTLAVLSSNDQSSKTLAGAFAAEVRELGGEIVAMEWYDRGITDLTKQLTNIRKKGNSAVKEPFLNFGDRLQPADIAKLSRLGVSRYALDTLIATRSVVNAKFLLGESAKDRLEEHGIPYLNGDPRIDSVQRVVTAVQGIYCPISSPSEIGVISSQIAYFNLKTRILGSGEWNNIAELNANRLYCRGVQFEADAFLDSQSPSYAEFSTIFYRRYNRFPNKLNLYGYNVTKVLLTMISRGAVTREQLRDALANLRERETTHSKFNFTGGRVNSWLHILEYSDNAIRHVTEIDVE